MTRIAAIMSVLLVLTLYPAATASAAGTGDWRAERELVSLINASRTARGLPAVRMADDLRGQARRHSYEMADLGRPAHTSNLGRKVCCWRKLGENVGVGTSPRALHAAFMRSSTHRAIILDPAFNEVGVGAVRHDGRLWVTQDFRRRR